MRDTIVIGASAGGVEAVGRLVEQLPADVPAAVLVALHLPNASISFLAQIFSRCAKLRVSAPRVTEPLALHHLYVVSPDRHLVVHDSEVRSIRSARVNGHRPAIDVLFRSAAIERHDRVIGVILSGMLDDGVGGLLEIRKQGGVAVVQQPEDATFPMLPTNAIAGAGADHVVALSDMGQLLVKLVTEPGSGGGRSPQEKGGPGASGGGKAMPSRKTSPPQDWSSPAEASPEGGRPSVYSCPECHGVLAKTGPDDMPRFVCRVGHAYDPESLLAEDRTAAEQAMWAAIRSAEELLSLTRKLALRARAIGDKPGEEQLSYESSRAERQVRTLRAAVDHDQER
ncbi:MAG TPA: chemotaxis protein CheB [Anaeromyxobacteraceae bacterium]|nr:chemotaxis protein CheB [Anaeromyxobacteraceae bacterium]